MGRGAMWTSRPTLDVRDLLPGGWVAGLFLVLGYTWDVLLGGLWWVG